MQNKDDVLRKGLLALIKTHGIRRTELVRFIPKRFGNGHVSPEHLSDILCDNGKSQIRGYYIPILCAINAVMVQRGLTIRFNDSDVIQAATPVPK